MYESILFQFNQKIDTDKNLIKENSDNLDYPIGCITLDFDTKF